MRELPTPAAQAAKVLPLPASLEHLLSQYSVDPLEPSADVHRRFTKIHSKYHIAAHLRLESVVNVPFGESVMPTKPEPPLEWQHELVRGACKVRLALSLSSLHSRAAEMLT